MPLASSSIHLDGETRDRRTESEPQWVRGLARPVGGGFTVSNGGSKELVGARPAAVSTVSAATSGGWSHHEAFQGFLWIAPAFLYLAFFIAYPFFMSLSLSVSSARVGSPESHFVGLQNYTRLFADPTFWQTVRNSFVFTLGSELIRLVIGLPLAFALNRSFKGKRVVQGIILIPFVIPIALSSLAWKWMFDSLYSVINWMLIHAHVIDYPWQWLGEPRPPPWSVIIMNVWPGFPFSAVLPPPRPTPGPHGGLHAA